MNPDSFFFSLFESSSSSLKMSDVFVGSFLKKKLHDVKFLCFKLSCVARLVQSGLD